MLVDVGGYHIVVLLIVVAIYVASLVMVWQSRGRGTVEKVVWTVLIVAVPIIGVLGWQANFWFGFIAARLNRPRGTAN